MSQYGWMISSSDEEDNYLPLSKRLKKSENNDLKENVVNLNSSDDEITAVQLSKKESHLNVLQNINNVKDNINFHEDQPRFQECTKAPKLNPKPVMLSSSSDEELPTFFPQKKQAIKETGPAPKPPKNKTQEHEEKQKRKATQNHIKTLRPAECLKYIICELSDLTMAMFQATDCIQKLSTESDATFCLYSSDLASVRWKRKVILSATDSTEIINDEPELAVLLPCNDFVEMINNENTYKVSEMTITRWLKNLKLQYSEFRIHPIIFGLKQYKKKIKRIEKQNFKKNFEALLQNTEETGNKTKQKRKKSNQIILSENEIQMALVKLQIHEKVFFRFVNTIDEFVQLVAQMTKAIAETPFKRMNTQDDAIILDVPAVKVNPNTGEGTKKAWKLMLQQFENVSADMALAVVEKYPSINSLLNAYNQCETLSKKELLLEDLIVRRGIGTLQTKRRIGPGLSKKIFIWATTTEPDKII